MQIPANSRRWNTVLNTSSCSTKRIRHKEPSSPQKPIWAFALWEPHCVTLPLWLLSGNILSLSLFSLATFSLKRSGSPIQKSLGNLSSALPSHRLALAETKSPSNRGKMKQTLHWVTVRRLSEREYDPWGRGGKGKVRVKNKYQLQTVWCLGERERERNVWKETGWFLWAWWVWCLQLCSPSKPETLLLSCQVNNTNKSG